MNCRVDQCPYPIKVKKHKLCNRHYLKLKRFGDPLNPPQNETAPGEAQEFFKNLIESKSQECIKWPFACTPSGCGIIHIKGRSRVVSRLICEEVHGQPPFEKAEAAHSCGKGNEGCVNPNHLRCLSRADNNREREEHGTDNKGQRHGMSKLKEEDVLLIRAALAEELDKEVLTLLRFEIAAKYGILERTVRAIRDRVSWKHI